MSRLKIISTIAAAALTVTTPVSSAETDNVSPVVEQITQTYLFETMQSCMQKFENTRISKTGITVEEKIPDFASAGNISCARTDNLTCSYWDSRQEYHSLIMVSGDEKGIFHAQIIGKNLGHFLGYNEEYRIERNENYFSTPLNPNDIRRLKEKAEEAISLCRPAIS